MGIFNSPIKMQNEWIYRYDLLIHDFQTTLQNDRTTDTNTKGKYTLNTSLKIKS